VIEGAPHLPSLVIQRRITARTPRHALNIEVKSPPLLRPRRAKNRAGSADHIPFARSQAKRSGPGLGARKEKLLPALPPVRRRHCGESYALYLPVIVTRAGVYCAPVRQCGELAIGRRVARVAMMRVELHAPPVWPGLSTIGTLARLCANASVTVFVRQRRHANQARSLRRSPRLNQCSHGGLCEATHDAVESDAGLC